MVKCCSAIGCASRCLPNSKLKGLTFHVGKEKNFIVEKTSPSKRFQSHTTITSLLVFPHVLKNSNPSSFLVVLNRRIESGSPGFAPGFKKQAFSLSPLNTVLTEHSYSVMDSPKKLKHKLDHVISELEDTKKSLRNVLDREKRFQKSLRKTIRELKDECLISQETANRLEAFCWECCQESIKRDYIS
ncbi:THAP domain-containing protein 6 isoform X2 [Vulpes lagopus]|uniref:THAP domain-containing protein 6 isoform X2 n=1 Tax=Vulpes lagopus TaxID=494514 RepID=UPI001BC9833D|nr:THAP domain-containing protein 6 isoform X2 [Vulpes lagopus]